MIAAKKQRDYYDALVRKDPAYVGVFYAAVKSTGIFCHSICPARKPKFENCEFFKTAEEALLASYRPCKRCRPLSPPQETTEMIRLLVEAVENEPERRWREEDFKEIGIDPSTVRRQFKKRFGMTFVQYARARRMGIAMKTIKKGGSVIGAQISTGYESGSGFRHAFAKIMGTPPAGAISTLFSAWLDTQLGPMLAVSNQDALLLLEFGDHPGLEQRTRRLRQSEQSAIVPGNTPPIKSIEKELSEYFRGERAKFDTPMNFLGTPFQKSVWAALLDLPAGETSSYAQIAQRLSNPNAARAVARANGANQLAIIVPCHRVIHGSGTLAGYGGGMERKKWLLDHEQNMTEKG